MDNSIKNTSWDDLPWRKFQIKLFQLQSRIYKAMQNRNIKETIKLQKTLLTSKSVHFIVVNEITKNTVVPIRGNYSKLCLTVSAKMALVEKLSKNLENWNHREMQKVFIYKPNGKTTLIKTPTFKDKIVECIWLYALEPTYKYLYLSKFC